MNTLARVFLDSHVLIYMVDHDAPRKRDIARALVLDHLGAGSLALSTQVLQEFFWTTTRRLEVPLSPAAARALAQQLHSAHIVAPSVDMVLAAMVRVEECGAPIWDALILTAAESCGADVLYTEDKHLLRLESPVRIVDPFAAG